MSDTWITIDAELPAIQIPTGIEVPLPEGIELSLSQELGGDFTVRTRSGALYRVDGVHAGALGRDPIAPELPLGPHGELTDEAVEETLKTVYDPEIPINILDLGLIYECVRQQSESGGAHIEVKMTLTAPGCGMGPVIADDVKRKLERLPGVDGVSVDLVFDPPWSPDMMSEAARLQTGMM